MYTDRRCPVGRTGGYFKRFGFLGGCILYIFTGGDTLAAPGLLQQSHTAPGTHFSIDFGNHASGNGTKSRFTVAGWPKSIEQIVSGAVYTS